MTCGQARRLLWPEGGPREATAAIVEAREHVSGCELCRRFFDDMRRLSGHIREAVPRPQAPVEVRDRLFKAIARARTASSVPNWTIRQRRWLAAGVAGVILTGGAVLGWSLLRERSSSAGDALGAIAEDHVRSQQITGVVSSDSLQVAQWLADRLPFAVEVPIFPEAQLKGARLLFLNRQSGAVVEYVIGGRPLSYYVLSATDADGPLPPREVRLMSRSGYRVAAWEDAGLTHALVAGLPGPKLVELAHYCMRQMMAISSARAPSRLDRSAS